MMAINGVFGKERGGFSYSDSYTRNNREARVNRWQNLPQRISRVAKRLRNARIENVDALKLFKRYLKSPATLAYLDPPYFADRTNGYNHDANNLKFHRDLLKLANSARCMVFISGYENALYRKNLTRKKGWTRKTIETTTRDSSGQIHKRKEVVWMNKYYQKAKKINRVPIKLTEKELKQKKLNPVR